MYVSTSSFFKTNLLSFLRCNTRKTHAIVLSFFSGVNATSENNFPYSDEYSASEPANRLVCVACGAHPKAMCAFLFLSVPFAFSATRPDRVALAPV